MSEKVRSWRALLKDRSIFSWALYDWANSVFATTVMAGLFPIFFKDYWSVGADPAVSTFQLGLANSVSAAALAFFSPFLGALADQWSKKKRLLFLFAILGILTTACLSLVAKGNWPLAALLYVWASIGFAGANSFYDALIISVCPKHETHEVSALGFSLGYLGGGVLLAINIAMIQLPEVFGLASAAQAVQVSFLLVAIWWTVFSLPLLLFVREEKRERGPSLQQIFSRSFFQVAETFREIRSYRNLGLFLIAYFFYIDGVNTMMRMAVDYARALGLPSSSLIAALLLVQFVGFPAALLYGQLAKKLGAKTSIYIAIVTYTFVTVFGYYMTSMTEFFVMAFLIGCTQGGIQALSRSVFAQMTPYEKAGEFFGFFNMLGKFSSMLGPVLVGWVAVSTGSSRLSILSLIPLFLIGSLLLWRVKLPSQT